MGWEIVVQGRDDVFHHSDYVEMNAKGNFFWELNNHFAKCSRKEPQKDDHYLSQTWEAPRQTQNLSLYGKKYAQIIGNNQLSHVLL